MRLRFLGLGFQEEMGACHWHMGTVYVSQGSSNLQWLCNKNCLLEAGLSEALKSRLRPWDVCAVLVGRALWD